MKTAGQILQATRLNQKLEVEEAARITKIRPHLISALEADDYSLLGSGTVAKGFIKNYGQYLGLKPDYILAVFRRDFIENQQGQIVPRGITEPVDQISFWTPRTTIIALVTLIFTLFGFYLLYQYRLLTGPPPLELTSPVNQQTISDSAAVEVIGRTDPQATLAVNGQLVALEKGGHFSFRFPLSPGPNQLTIVATAKSGKSTSLTRTVTLR